MKAHKFGVNNNYLVTRHLALTGQLNTQAAAIVGDIEELLGINTVRFDAKAQALKVSYDASKRNISEITAIVVHHDCSLLDSRWQRFKRGWYRYFDQNIKENAAKEPWRCH